MATLDRSFPLDHAAAKGHFPGNPIIPGALLLSEVLLAIETDLGRSLQSCQVKSAKFVHPVRPGDRVSIEYSGQDEGTIRFRCSAGGKAVLTGTYGVPPSSVREGSNERDI
jgi:3-hydroxymyristoyl/3-hydroxydecanoyl-(acyl carrier protein) dehydratase